jgi:hypothetical protein
MRTTLDIDDRLAAEAKALAAREHTSLTRLVEEGLALRLHADRQPRSEAVQKLPVFPGKGGLQRGIADTLTHRALLDAADGEG